MINQLLILLTTIFVYEFIKYFNLIKIIAENLKIYKKIIILFTDKKASDDLKEKLILEYSKLLFKTSFKIIVIIIAILIFIYAMNEISSTFIDFTTSFYGLLEITLFFLIYSQIRKKINAKL